MTRGIDSATQTESKKGDVRLEWLARLEFDDDDVTAWTGIGDLAALGHTFVGVGDFGGVSGIEETQELKASSIRLTLSGIPSELISIALDTDYKNRPCKVWMAFFDSDDNIVGSAVKMFEGRMDVMVINEVLDQPSITVEATHILADLNKANERRWTPEDQKIEHPNDEFLDFVPKIAEKEIVWEKS